MNHLLRLRFFLLLIVAGVVVPEAGAQTLDPEFTSVPFESWLGGREQTHFNWMARIYPPRLSNHQRLQAGIHLQVDGTELARRRGKGKLLMFIQITDADGRRFQDHGTVDLEKLEEGIKSSDIVYTENMFVLPGNYRVALALYITATREHCVKELNLRVASLKNDPIPFLWKDLPPIEFVPVADQPDSWFLPTIRGRLHPTLDGQLPLEIEVIVNVTPTDRLVGRRRTQDRDLGVLLAPLKAIAEVASHAASMNVELFDLSHQQVIFHQENVRALDWAGMKASLAGQTSHTIEVESLESRTRNAASFVKEVERRLSGEDRTPRIVLILSRPMSFEVGQVPEPITAKPSPSRKVFYMRCHSQWTPMPATPQRFPAEMGPRGGMRPIGPVRATMATLPDQLAPLFEPLAPRLFDIETPEQFRKALATLLSEMSKL